jgi:hypothetical protein
MMKLSRTFSMSWSLLAAVLAGTALAGGTSALSGQAASAPAETQNAAPTIFLSGPSGDRFTLVRSADDGWRLQAGWNAEGAGWSTAVLAAAGAPSVAAPQTLERPLTVFVDGPIGFTFMYILDDGWKFAGRVADRAK